VAFALLSLSFFAACLITGLLIPVLRGRCLDVPNGRSSHDRPTPRAGGLGILAGVAAGLLLAQVLGRAIPSPVILLAALAVAAAGLADDLRGGVSPWVRLIVQIMAATVVCLTCGSLQRLPLPAPLDVPLGWLGVPLAVAWIVGVTNYFNFLDGIDGYAGLQASVAGLAIALLGIDGGSSSAGLCIAGASLGFLVHNWRPAKVFMGDVGSSSLGFLLAALPLGAEAGERSRFVFAAALFLWFFLADGLFTMTRRLMRGERVWEPHRSHLYQQLVQSGLRHDQVALRVMTAAALLCTGAVIAQRTGAEAARWFVLAVAVAAFSGYVAWTILRQRRRAAPPAAHLTPAAPVDERQGP
jgi:UDP-N-acetylmuramyl pentapeptide phosphotransferase/UDP-N-acetylglucosamine-1-phosphate transferase